MVEMGDNNGHTNRSNYYYYYYYYTHLTAFSR